MRYFLLFAALGLLLAGCGRNMYDQEGKYETYETSDLFEDGTSARPLIEGTVTRTRGDVNEAFFSGQDANGLLSESPIPDYGRDARKRSGALQHLLLALPQLQR